MMRISYADLVFSTSRRIRLAASIHSSPPNLVPVRNGISSTSAVDIQQEATSVIACCIQDSCQIDFCELTCCRLSPDTIWERLALVSGLPVQDVLRMIKVHSRSVHSGLRVS